VELNDFQAQIAKYDLFRPSGKIDMAMLDKVLGLTGEAGEVADKFKKLIRDNSCEMTAADRTAIAKELGDVFWYLATLARYLDIPLEEVAGRVFEKLDGRTARGTIAGSGDER
jgi:NTP pyrophosphatase (non-canonical NTP hydrolase)